MRMLHWTAAVCVGFITTTAALAGTSQCDPPAGEPTFTVELPKLGAPPNPLGWDLPAVWEGHPGATDDSITIPRDRPIYALVVSGYGNNAYLDQLMVYGFARHLMAHGAYVHFAWWNNLLAPYMERPLHYDQSHPGTAENVATDFLTPEAAEDKAVPGENYQFIADAKLLLSAIREHNPQAVIILVGHSMGGHSVAQLANETEMLIDLVAPIDPVWSRTYPWAGPSFQNADHYNWTRYRATREMFNGYRSMEWEPDPPFGGECVAVGPWRQTYAEAAAGSGPLCAGMVHIHGAPAMTFGSNIINLYHRWQHEAAFPFDFDDVRLFNPGFPFPPGGSEVQLAVSTQSGGTEDGGWPAAGLPAFSCCPNFDGVGWPNDGHGEIIGARGPVPPAPKSLAFRVRTSPECGSGCPNLIWPARTYSDDTWGNPSPCDRVDEMQTLEALPLGEPWVHEPYNPSLCRVSQALIARFDSMNKPPIADAGLDQLIECDGCDSALVTLDGSASFDPDPGDFITQYTWTSPLGSATGAVVDVTLPRGVAEVMLEVTDRVGHVTRDFMTISISDPDAPVTPYRRAAHLWTTDAGGGEALAFDTLWPGIPDGAGCLLDDPLAPAVIPLADGTVIVSASFEDKPYCAISDSGTADALSDVRLNEDASATFEFRPAVTAFYTCFGSLAIGETVSMHLHSDAHGSLPVDIVTSVPSIGEPLAAGLGFVSTVPIDRVEFTATEAGPVLIGAFTGLLPDEPSLGTIDLGDYEGPDGTGVIHLDFGCAFGSACPADIAPPGGDGMVNLNDLLELLVSWGACADPTDCPADISGDDVVGVTDLLELLTAWGPCP